MLQNAEWLRGQVERGASVAAMAAETGRTRAVSERRSTRYGIALPSRQLLLGDTDWDMLERDWRAGHPIATIARLFGVTEHLVRYLMRNVPRQPLPQQRPSKCALLNDPSELRVQLATGRRSL